MSVLIDDLGIWKGYGAYQVIVLAVVPALLLGLVQVINPVFIVAALGASVCAALALFRPLSGFLWYLAAIQVVDYFKRLLLAFGTPSPIEWYGILLLPDLILVAVLVGVLLRGKPLQPLGRKYRAVALFLCLYACWYTVRTVWTAAPLVNAAGKWKQVIPYYVCFYLGARLLDDAAALRSVLKTLAAAVGVAALYGIWQFVFGLTGFEQRWLYDGYTGLDLTTVLYDVGIPRVFSFYSDPATLGSVAACVGTLLLFSRRYFGRHWWNSWLLLSLLAIAMAMTVVRAAWLLAFLGGIAWIYAQWKAPALRKTLLLTVLVACIGLAGIVAISSAWDVESSMLFRAFDTGTFWSRTTSYQNLFDMGIIGFVVGKGVATVPGFAKDFTNSWVSGEIIAHDYMTESLYELGWVGFGLFIVLIARILSGRAPAFVGTMSPALKYVVWSVPLIAVVFGGSLLVVRPVTTLLWSSAGMLCCSTADSDAVTSLSA